MQFPFCKLRAFSLIELMIVVAIIGILVAVALPQFKSMTDDAKMAKMKDDMRLLRDLLIRYVSIESMPLESIDNLLGKYIGVIPTDPWGNKYAIDAHWGILYSYGPDGKKGTFDDYKVVYDENAYKAAKKEYESLKDGTFSQGKEEILDLKSAQEYLDSHEGALLLLAFIFDKDGGHSLDFLDFLKEGGLSQLESIGDFKVAIVDFNSNRFYFAKYNVTFTPTFILIDSNNEILGKIKGFEEKEVFLDALKEILDSQEKEGKL